MWTKSQKISAAVLGLAVAAFGVDRFILGSGDSGEASAAVTSPAKRASTAVKRASDNSVATTAAAPARPAMTLANRLAAFGEARGFVSAPAADAFRPADEWLALGKKDETKREAAKPATTGKPPPPKVNYAANFLAAHHLTAVMKKQGGGMAIVDGKLYKAGQTLDGFKLTAVGLNDATFTGHGTTVTLKLPNPQADVR